MSAAKGTRFSYLAHLPALGGLGVLLLLAAVTMTTAASGRLQASAKADFTLTASPTTANAQQGQAATITVTEQKVNGFNSAVALIAGNLPAGTTAAFSPQTLDTKTTSALTLNVGVTTAPGTYSGVTITGSGGGLSHTLTVTLVVAAAPTQTFALGATPASATMLPGSTAAYSVSTSAVNGFTGTITLSLSGAPAGATTTFSPSSVPVGSSSTLQVVTKNNTPGGNYTLTVTGTSGTRQQSAAVTLVITTTGKQFSISAPVVSVQGPGAATPLNLTLTNPNNQALQVTNLTVAIASVTKAASAPANRPCTAADYAVVQFSGSYPIVVGAGQAISLLGQGITSSQWPALTMINTSLNQDGCKGASVSLTFSGTGQG
jgi:hypothetical protein